MENSYKPIIIKNEMIVEDIEVSVASIQQCTEHITNQVKKDFQENGSVNAMKFAKLSKQMKVFWKYYEKGCFSINLNDFKKLNPKDLFAVIPEAITNCEKKFGKLQDEGIQK